MQLDLAPYSVQQQVPGAQCPVPCPFTTSYTLGSQAEVCFFLFCLFWCSLFGFSFGEKFVLFCLFYYRTGFVSLSKQKVFYLFIYIKRERERQYCSHTCKLRGNTNHTAFHRNRNRQTAFFFFNTYGLI